MSFFIKYFEENAPFLNILSDRNQLNNMSLIYCRLVTVIVLIIIGLLVLSAPQFLVGHVVISYTVLFFLYIYMKDVIVCGQFFLWQVM